MSISSPWRSKDRSASLPVEDSPAAAVVLPTSTVQAGLPMIVVTAAVAGLTVFAYWGVWNFQFVNFDDGTYVFDNPHVTGGLTGENFRWSWTSFRGSNWHPLTWISLQLDATLFRPTAAGFHATNLFLHVCNSGLVLLLCRRFWSSLWPGILVAALFAVHPQHVESVAWISERKDVLSTFFGLVALLLYCRFADRPTICRHLAVTTAYVLSLLTKPMLVTLPFLLLVFDWWPLRRLRTAEQSGLQAPTRSLRGLVLEKLPWFVLSLASCVVTVLAQRSGGALRDLGDLGTAYRLANAVAGYAFYVLKAFWPTGLIVFYPPPDAYPLAGTVVGATWLLGLTGVLLAFAKRRPYLLFGWLWFVGTLVPVIGLIQVGAQAYADRYSYFPLIGLLVMVAGTLLEVARRGPAGRAIAVALGCAAIAVCTALTREQQEYWQDGKCLWEHALAVTPDNYCAHRHIADLLAEEDCIPEAIEHARAAAQLWPYQVSYVQLAAFLVRAERYDEAIEQYRNAVRSDPADVDSQLMLGNLLLQRYRPEEAIESFEEALARESGWADAYNGLATAHALAGHHDRALRNFKAAVAAEPRNPLYHNNLAQELARTGDSQAALSEFAEALRIDPHYAEALNNRGNVLASLARWPEATLSYRDAIEQDAGVARYRFNLAMALEERGELEGARRQYEAALAIDPDWPRHATEKAWALATAAEAAQRDGPTAVRLARQACQAKQAPLPAALDALAAAYADTGQFADAVQAAGQALERARAEGDAELAAAIERRIEMYRENKPFRTD